MGIYEDHLPGAICEQLRAERAAKGMTFKELAARTQTHEQTLMKYFKGTRDIPMKELIKIAEAFDISPGEIIRRAIERMK